MQVSYVIAARFCEYSWTPATVRTNINFVSEMLIKSFIVLRCVLMQCFVHNSSKEVVNSNIA